MATAEKKQQGEAAEGPARTEPEVVEGSLRDALNSGDYGVDYQRSDYSQDAEHDEATHAENKHREDER
ncbi:hypothetical protein FGE12_21905 [Aggregicoccus sp. 17bor-14]|uniref:hypothetical protein n=1 Tax=Myxococcaceae TaxID=31 RepID=UPI00129C5FCA|nr:MULTISPECIES: hypothetical protein [Myxococcaceae]MBF5045072.1 hypothetical protein [Simulacricoccus sp. 17bor-14]MRI90814.1 hypothetical protein [Aggregicoccus sp. 17bor-14]